MVIVVIQHSMMLSILIDLPHCFVPQVVYYYFGMIDIVATIFIYLRATVVAH